VLASYKVLVAVFLVPLAWFVYVCTFVVWFGLVSGVAFLLALPLFSYASVRLLEQGVQIWRSSSPVLRMFGSSRFVEIVTELKSERENLVHVVRELVEKVMPQLGPEFVRDRVISKETIQQAEIDEHRQGECALFPFLLPLTIAVSCQAETASPSSVSIAKCTRPSTLLWCRTRLMTLQARWAPLRNPRCMARLWRCSSFTCSNGPRSKEVKRTSHRAPRTRSNTSKHHGFQCSCSALAHDDERNCTANRRTRPPHIFLVRARVSSWGGGLALSKCGARAARAY
jgi:hypothetical protein